MQFNPEKCEVPGGTSDATGFVDDEFPSSTTV
jgi:hypothetical protein